MTKSKPLTPDSLLGRTPAAIKKQLARLEKAKTRSRRRKTTYTLAEVKAASDLAANLTDRIHYKLSGIWHRPRRPRPIAWYPGSTPL